MIEYLYLGRIGYREALALQQELVELRIAGRIDNTLLLLEHPPVLTLGRNAHRSNILATDEQLAARGVTVHEINRGGDVTYHGPGQLVGYPIFDLRSLHNSSGGRLGPVDFVRRIEEALIRLCGLFGVHAGRIPGLTGVWCPADGSAAHGKTLVESTGKPEAPDKNHPAGEAKIAAIGIHVSRGVTSHGFAFNRTTRLDDFHLINPCGITDRPVTSLAQQLGESAQIPEMEAFAHQAARQFGLVFGQQVLALEDLAALRAQAEAAAPPPQKAAAPEYSLSSTTQDKIQENQKNIPAPKYPAEDTPAQPPESLERLRKPGGGPIST
jgi:lipoyl(octanoyl) transferase